MRPWLQLLCVLLILSASAGCARRVVMHFAPVRTNVKTITISGHVRWRGNLPDGTLEISATPVPTSPGASAPTRDMLNVAGLHASPGGATGLAYDLGTLPMVARVTTTETKRRFRGRLPITRANRRTVSVETYTVDHYVVRLQPPAGWSVSPPQHEVRTSTKGADFVLPKAAGHRQTHGKGP